MADRKQVKWTAAYKKKKQGTPAYKAKERARAAVSNEVRAGKATKPSKADKCPNCGRSGYRKEYHHSAYTAKGKGKGQWRCSACNPRPGK